MNVIRATDSISIMAETGDTATSSPSSATTLAPPSLPQPTSYPPAPARGGTFATFATSSGVCTCYSIYCLVRGICLPTWFVRFEPFPNSTAAAAAAIAAGGSLGAGWRRNEDGSMPITWIADAATGTVMPYRDRGTVELALLALSLVCAVGVLGEMQPSKRWSIFGFVVGICQGMCFFGQAALIIFFRRDATPNIDAGHGFLATGFGSSLEALSLISIAVDGARNKFKNDVLKTGEQKFLIGNALVVVVLIAGGLGFSYLGQFDFETSFPFAIVTVLSLGYGSPPLPTATARVFLIVYFVMAACAFAAFFYGKHEMIVENHEANVKKKMNDRHQRREQVLERFNSRLSERTARPTQTNEDESPNSHSISSLVRGFGLYFGLLRPTASEQALIERRAARLARKRRTWEKAREEKRRNRLITAAGRLVGAGSALRMRVFATKATAPAGEGANGEDSDAGDDAIASEAVVEVLAGSEPDIEAGRSDLGRTFGSDTANASLPAATAPPATRPRAAERAMTEVSKQSVGLTEGMMEDELAKIIERRRVRLFFLTVAALWLVSAYIFQWTEPTWTYFDAFYFCFTTMATIGTSDLFPTTSYCWEVWFVFVMTAVGMYASLFGIVGEIWARKYDLAMVRHQARTHERRNRAKFGRPSWERSSERD
ncbi:hypothetical protein DFJ73DRAFT_832640 [Zopfochytrium polystomum]|nr:hypothetical protein DFJ73DRAFT_832640 [Zopfochytrium polystomum]